MALQKAPLTPSPAPIFPVASTATKRPIDKKALQEGVSSLPFWIGLSVSVAWVVGVFVTIAQAGPTHSLVGVPLVDWAIGVSAAVSPVAMVWMVTAYLQRAADIRVIADPLRRQLTLITGESGAAHSRISRFNQVIREQIELLRSAQTASRDDLEAAMDRVRQHRGELERFENVSSQQVKEIQDIIRRSMIQLEQTMDDKFTMLRVLDGKLQQNGDGVARQVEGMSSQITKMLEELEHNSAQVADALERAQRDSKKLSDTSRLQESSLTNAAEVAAETLGGLSGKIDLSVARFLERASTAREEAERLAHALDVQTRVLDEFSTTLPSRVSEAEAVLRGVADRLYASEQMAREQAVHLSEKLSQQVDGLQSFMDRFTTRMSDIDAGLDRRGNDLSGLAERIGVTTSGFVTSWEKSLQDLNGRTDNALLRFTVVNNETRRNADEVAAHLSETTDKYEDVVLRMRALSAESGEQMKGMTEEVARHLVQFEALSQASSQAGEEVQQRAGIALQNLQHVLERVLTAREATQAAGETLVKDIYAAVDQNEKMIGRLSETAQLGARAIGVATENLGRQEGILVEKMRTGESVILDSVQKIQQQAETAEVHLRQQTENLQKLLAETQAQLVTTDHKLQNFAAQAVAPVQKVVHMIDASADQGLRTISNYGEGLSQQVLRLQEFTTRIGGMSQEMGKTTVETASAFENLSERFSNVRATQEESARQTLAQFSDLSDRMQREVSGLDENAKRAVEKLQEAALKVGEQSYQMLENAQTSSTQVKDIAAILQAEAAQIQDILRKQTEEINTDLVRAEQKFASLGETIRERADATTTLLDRAAASYGVVAQTVDQAVVGSQTKVEGLQAALARQADRIGVDATRIETYTSDIAASTDRAVQNLSTLNEKLFTTHENVVGYAEQSLNKLDESATAFQRRTIDVTEASHAAIESVHKAGSAFGEQAGKMIDGTHQIDVVLRQLTSATTSLTDQAAHIRLGMEQQNHRLLTQLTDTITQLDTTNDKLQQVAATAVLRADHASERFATLTDTTTQRLGMATEELASMAQRSESNLAALGVGITQQAASLAVVGDQIGEQQRLLSIANEAQRTQMIDLFDKLGKAHAQASEIAEASIQRLSQSLQDIQNQIGTVGETSQQVIGSVETAGRGFSDQSALLVQNAQSAEHQARAVLAVTSALQEQARHLREGLQSESERAGETLSLLLGRLTSGGAELRQLGDDTGAVLTGLQRAIWDQARDLGTSMNQISDRQRVLTTTLDQQRDVINGLLNRLTLAQDETASVAERTASSLEEGTRAIARNVETIDLRAQSALANVSAAANGFVEGAQKIEAQAGTTEQRAHVILSSAAALHEKIQGMHVDMQKATERTTHVFGDLLGKTSAGVTEIRELGATTEQVLTTLADSVTQKGAALTTTMKNIEDQHYTLATAINAQGEVANNLLNRLTMVQNETASVAERSAARLDESTQQITRNVEAIDLRAQSALANVTAAANGFVEGAQKIEAQAETTEQRVQVILTSAAALHEKIQGMHVDTQKETERTTQVLGDLLGKTAAGASDIRELGATTEQVLTTLADGMTQKGSTLTTTMKSIEDQHYTLAGAIDAQGEVVNNLLNRLTTAQNETAAVAERSAARLDDSTQQITRQIDQIGTQTDKALAGVQASALGFAEQASALNLQSQQAEQQVRGVLSVTAGMQDQARHLREAMQVETARIVESLSSVITQLDTANRQLKTESGEAVDTLDQSAQRFTAAAGTGVEMIRKQTEVLTQAADQSEARLSNAGEKLRNHLRLVGEMGDKTEDQARRLADTAEFAATRLVNLRDTFATSEKEGGTVVENASQRIEAVRASLQGALQNLSDLSQQAVAQVSGATQGLAQQSDALRTNLAVSESALTEAADLVREENKHIPATISRSVTEIQNAARALREHASETDQALVGTADRFISVTAAARDNMVEELTNVSVVASEADKVLRGFSQALAEQVGAMRQSASVLSGEQRELVEKAVLSVGTLSEASDRLSVLRSEAVGTAERLAREFDGLDQRAATTGSRLTQISEVLVKQTEAIAEASTRAETQMVGAGKGLREQLETIRSGMQAQIDDINRGLLQITVQLERTGTTLRSTAVGAVGDIERIGQRFEQTGGTATLQVQARMDQMRAATENASQLLSSFDKQFDSMLDHMAIAGDGIKRQEGDVLSRMQTMLSHLGAVAEKLEAARSMSDNVSQHAIERLDEVVTAVQAQMTNMTAGAQTAAGIMRSIGQIYSDQTQSLSKGVGEAHTQVVTMNESIGEMQQRTDRMRASLKLQGDDLMSSLRQILIQLEMTSDGLSDAVDRTLQQQATDELKKIG